MKKFIYLFITTAVICAFMINISNSNHSGTTSEINAKASTEKTYTLKNYDGIIGIFEGNAQTPFDVIDVPLISLPVQDQKFLKKGITAQNKEDLYRLIEDFSS